MFTRREPGDTTSSDSASGTNQNTTARSSTSAATPGESLIAAEDTFEGEIKTTIGVRVLGTVRGTIESERSVRIEEGARVEADITAEEVVIAGTYSGTLTCRNRVEITSTANVSGKIDTAKLYLHEGGFFDGALHMQRPGAAETPRAGTATEEARPRRSRYVDISSDTPRPATEGSTDVEKQEEAAT